MVSEGARELSEREKKETIALTLKEKKKKKKDAADGDDDVILFASVFFKSCAFSVAPPTATRT